MNASQFYRALNKLRKEPKAFCLDCTALVRGAFYAAFYRLFRKNVRISLPFLAYAKVTISGSGSVVIDRWCAVHLNAYEGLTIVTLFPDAEVRIGKRCNLGGLTIRCANRVEIGDRVMSANCLVQDTLFSSWTPARKHCGPPDLVSRGSVSVGGGVWLTSRTIVLGDSSIGKNSVLGLASVCLRFAIPEGRLAIGNPTASTLSTTGVNRFFRDA